MDAPGAARSPGRRRLGRALAIAAAVGIVCAPAGWVVTDVLEQRNDFCNACHLEPGAPLHIRIRRDFDAAPPATLAAAHGAARVEGRADAAFRCIDCHGGVGLAGRLRVKTLAARDAFWYVTGHFEEPDAMRWPLRDADCRRCHAHFDESQAEAWQSPRFHQLGVHNVKLGVACVECHQSHVAGGNPDAYFLDAAHVRSRCARCHSEFEEGEG
jgi:nitrate/TMAO reductase-like tetraheme cytochrome c subunit